MKFLTLNCFKHQNYDIMEYHYMSRTGKLRYIPVRVCEDLPLSAFEKAVKNVVLNDYYNHKQNPMRFYTEVKINESRAV